MSFVQLHRLSVAPPSNANRDDTGRHKTIHFGGVPRLRVSSQAIKRAIRTSAQFSPGEQGTRTRLLPDHLRKKFVTEGFRENEVTEAVSSVLGTFWKIDSSDSFRTADVLFLSPQEIQNLTDLIRETLRGRPVSTQSQVLLRCSRAVDLALFGRMLPRVPEYSFESAVQVAHAFTTHRAIPEVDPFVAVDDLSGDPAYAGLASFGSGVFYSYGCVDQTLLTRNLGGDEDLATASVAAFIRAFAMTWPTARQSSFAHVPPATYLRAEHGVQQPRSLAGAFFHPVSEDDALTDSISALEDMAAQFENIYGPSAETIRTMDMQNGQVDLDSLINSILP